MSNSFTSRFFVLGQFNLKRQCMMTTRFRDELLASH